MAVDFEGLCSADMYPIEAKGDAKVASAISFACCSLANRLSRIFVISFCSSLNSGNLGEICA